MPSTEPLIPSTFIRKPDRESTINTDNLKYCAHNLATTMTDHGIPSEKTTAILHEHLKDVTAILNNQSLHSSGRNELVVSTIRSSLQPAILRESNNNDAFKKAINQNISDIVVRIATPQREQLNAYDVKGSFTALAQEHSYPIKKWQLELAAILKAYNVNVSREVGDKGQQYTR